MSSFLKDVREADIHESYIIELLRQQGHTVIDVRHEKEYQSQDIDIIVDNIPIEIKADNLISKTGNIFAERYSHKGLKTQGWIYKTKATYIYYYDTVRDIIYSILTQDLLNYIDKYKQRLRLVSGGDNSQGWIISIRLLGSPIIYRGIKQ